MELTNAISRVNKGQVFFWLVYLALLGVLLPHTAWAFARFEPNTTFGVSVSWAAAFAFESALAVLTHKMAERISNTPARWEASKRFWFVVLSPYSVGLLITTGVSIMANFAHAVEFGQGLVLVGSNRIFSLAYSVAFGAILPVASLLFAWVLSQESAIELGETEEAKRIESLRTKLDEYAAKIKAYKAEMQKLTLQAESARKRAEIAENSALTAQALVEAFSLQLKADRIKAIAALPIGANGTQIAKLVGSTAGYVSDVLNKNGKAK